MQKYTTCSVSTKDSGEVKKGTHTVEIDTAMHTLAVFRLETRGYLVPSHHAEVYRPGTAQHRDASRVESSDDLSSKHERIGHPRTGKTRVRVWGYHVTEPDYASLFVFCY